MFKIIITTTLSDFIAINILKSCNFLLNHNSVSIQPQNKGEVHSVWLKELADPVYNYSPSSLNLLSTIIKHRKHLTAIKSCTVLVKQYISDIRISIFKSLSLLIYDLQSED